MTGANTSRHGYSLVWRGEVHRSTRSVRVGTRSERRGPLYEYPSCFSVSLLVCYEYLRLVVTRCLVTRESVRFGESETACACRAEVRRDTRGGESHTCIHTYLQETRPDQLGAQESAKRAFSVPSVTLVGLSEILTWIDRETGAHASEYVLACVCIQTLPPLQGRLYVHGLYIRSKEVRHVTSAHTDE